MVKSDWSGEGPNDYLHSFEGQVEYWLVQILAGSFSKVISRTPWYWFGGYNEIQLYLSHPSYSPFFDWGPVNSCLMGKGKQPLTWRVDDIPEGQEHMVDENFIPIAFKK